MRQTKMFLKFADSAYPGLRQVSEEKVEVRFYSFAQLDWTGQGDKDTAVICYH